MIYTDEFGSYTFLTFVKYRRAGMVNAAVVVVVGAGEGLAASFVHAFHGHFLGSQKAQIKSLILGARML